MCVKYHFLIEKSYDNQETNSRLYKTRALTCGLTTHCI